MPKKPISLICTQHKLAIFVCLRVVLWLLSFVVKLRHDARKICLIFTQHKLAKVQCPRQWHFVRDLDRRSYRKWYNTPAGTS